MSPNWDKTRTDLNRNMFVYPGNDLKHNDVIQKTGSHLYFNTAGLHAV